MYSKTTEAIINYCKDERNIDFCKCIETGETEFTDELLQDLISKFGKDLEVAIHEIAKVICDKLRNNKTKSSEKDAKEEVTGSEDENPAPKGEVAVPIQKPKKKVIKK